MKDEGKPRGFYIFPSYYHFPVAIWTESSLTKIDKKPKELVQNSLLKNIQHNAIYLIDLFSLKQ